MKDVDIFRAARIMMAEHGDGAELAAAIWADKMCLEEDGFAFRIWVRIKAAMANGAR